MIAAPNKNNRLDVSYGHGNDVLSLSQLHNVLAIRLFGQQENIPRKVFSTVSLIDIKPTILNLLNIPYSNVDGKTLKPYVTHKKIKDIKTPRMIFIDRGFTPSATLSASMSGINVLMQSTKFFQINPITGAFTVNP